MLITANLLVNLFCIYFQCEFGLQPPFFQLHRNPFQSQIKPLPFVTSREGENFKSGEENVIVKTGSGFIQGFPMRIPDSRRIFAFTGVPYGDKPGRFEAPKVRRPWEGIWQATSPSPYCLQSSAATGNRVQGQEDCLFLDVYTPSLNNTKNLPVIMWIPGGGFLQGRSKTYGPTMLLREDVILVAINVRVGIFGWASTGGLGNWGLKDQLLAVEWVYQNILHFGGNPEKIVIGGISSGGVAAGLVPFVNHPARDYITGIISASGVPFNSYGLNDLGTVTTYTGKIARLVKCPTGSSSRMMDCLKKINPYVLGNIHRLSMPLFLPFGFIFGPVVEVNHTSAVILELPEEQYRTGKVAKIPWIMGKSENESSLSGLAVQFVFSRLRLLPQWREIASKILKLLLPQQPPGAVEIGKEEIIKNMDKLCQVYFCNNSSPLSLNNYLAYVHLVDDSLFGSPLWRAVKVHHEIAPTYVYTITLKTLEGVDFGDLFNSLLWPVRGVGAVHGSEAILLFNSSTIIDSERDLSKELKTAGRNMINLLVNFANTGKPVFRSPEGQLKDVWKPVESMANPLSLEVGLVDEIKMFQDPLVGSKRYKIWEEIRL